MKIKDGYLLREVAGSFIVVAVGEAIKEFNGIVNLNSTAAFLWKELSTDKSEEQLVSALLSEYDVERSKAEEDVKKFISKLTEAKLIK